MEQAVDYLSLVLERQERLRASYTEGNQNDCWEWTGLYGSGGYGVLNLRMNRKIPAHRAVMLVLLGTNLPGDLFVCHKCDNRACVNPHHMFLGDVKDNARDMVNKGRHKPFPGEKNPASKLTEIQVREILVSSDSMRSLGRKYGVCDKTIRLIKSREMWNHVQV